MVQKVTKEPGHSTVQLLFMDFPGGSAVKNPPAAQETYEIPVQALGQEDPLEKEMATHSSMLAWRIPMDREAWWATVQGSRMTEVT